MSEYKLLILLHRVNKEVGENQEKPITELTRQLQIDISNQIPKENRGDLKKIRAYLMKQTLKLRAMAGI